MIARSFGWLPVVALAFERTGEAFERGQQPSAKALPDCTNDSAGTLRRDGQRGPTQRFSTLACASLGVFTTS